LRPVPKKDDEGYLLAVHICLDIRGTNEVTINDDQFVLPSVEDILQRLGARLIFAEIDLFEAYTQFEVAKESRKYCCFTWYNTRYQYRAAPFGQKNLPSIFQRCMTVMFADMDFVEILIDNLLIGSDSFEQHQEHVSKVLRRLNEYNLRVKPSSVKVCHHSLRVLGHVLSVRGIGMDPTKMGVITKWELPEDAANMRAYIGFTAFMSSHVRHYADLVAPLNAAKTGDGKIQWTPLMISHFHLLKEAIARAPMLAYANMNKRFVLACDASRVGAGCVLYQPDDDNDTITANNIVACYSRKYTKVQVKYSTYKKELYAIVLGLRRFHTYLYLREFTVITDHQPLIHLLKTPDIPHSLQQWMDVILQYNFTVKHRPGILHVLPDALSRMYRAAYADGTVWGLHDNIKFQTVIGQVLTTSEVMSAEELEKNRLLSTTEMEQAKRKALKTTKMSVATMTDSVIPASSISLAASLDEVDPSDLFELDQLCEQGNRHGALIGSVLGQCAGIAPDEVDAIQQSQYASTVYEQTDLCTQHTINHNDVDERST
jgi:hypothetical protein